jgi:hypothetical protein
MQRETASLSRPGPRRLPSWLQGRRKWWTLALPIVIAAIVFGWPWLAPLGALPLLVSVLPCLAMCALGLCMQRMNGTTCQTVEGQARAPKEES